MLSSPTAMGITGFHAFPSIIHYSISPATCQGQAADAVAAFAVHRWPRPPAPEIICASQFPTLQKTLNTVERHVWQDALDDVIAFTKTDAGSHARRKQTIERSFAEAKANHGLRYARMLGIKNMREQCFLTAAVQNIKRLVASLLFFLSYSKPCIPFVCRVCQ